MSLTNVHESCAQFRGAWRFFASRSRAGEVLETPEVFIASGNVTWPLMNAAFLPAPAQTQEELERAVAAAARHFAPRKRSWTFILSQDWLAPQVRERAPEVFGAHGLKTAVDTFGMVAERLRPPVQPLPSLDIRHVTEAEGVRHIADINASSYDTPLEVGREAFAVPGFFEGECQGYVGYVDGQPVTSAAVVRVEGIAYVAMVATLAPHRQRGYAEAVMRHALAEAHRTWGAERTALHATPEGRPLYLRMGYRDVTRFQCYMFVAQGR